MGKMMMIDEGTIRDLLATYGAKSEEIDNFIQDLIEQLPYDYCLKKTIKTGFDKLDELNFLQTNNVTTIYGNPASGKTIFALNVIVNLLKQDKHCAIFSLAESKENIICYLACIKAKIDISAFIKDELTEEERKDYDNAVQWLSTKKLEIYDGYFTAIKIYEALSREPNSLKIRLKKPDIVFIDGIGQLILTRQLNGIDILECIKNRDTGVIITETISGLKDGELKDDELINITDKLVKLKNLHNSLDGYDEDIDLIQVQIINGGDKGQDIILKKDNLFFMEKEDEYNAVDDT